MLRVTNLCFYIDLQTEIKDRSEVMHMNITSLKQDQHRELRYGVVTNGVFQGGKGYMNSNVRLELLYLKRLRILPVSCITQGT